MFRPFLVCYLLKGKFKTADDSCWTFWWLIMRKLQERGHSIGLNLNTLRGNINFDNQKHKKVLDQACFVEVQLWKVVYRRILLEKILKCSLLLAVYFHETDLISNI